MHRYFVSYLFQGPYGIAAGSCELTIPLPITSMQDVQVVTDHLQRQGLQNVTIMSFNHFDTPSNGKTR